MCVDVRLLMPDEQIVASLENQKDILQQVQEIIVPIIVYTLSRQSVQAIGVVDA